ncbi:MAG TPA: hypothetical protein DCL54_16455 [Alphaproteobacteria bacterium]|nr:hypothetical protein [Alphaproteobacteria bacterium]HAJ48166.1 hypothetical protein [Alphaproteobacteria bacterium]
MEEQVHPRTKRRRTIGRYVVLHDGRRVRGLAGWTAEAKGPGANAPEGNGLRIEAGVYPLATWNGERYKTFGYAERAGPNTWPKPGLELRRTNKRTEILIHPGRNFLSSVGCINLCTELGSAQSPIDPHDSHARVLALIADLQEFCARFPAANGRPIPGAVVQVIGEPAAQ